MNKSDGTGIDWPVFFGINFDRKSIVKTVRENTDERADSWEARKHRFVISSLNGGDGWSFYRDESYYEACRVELLRFCVELTDFARDMLGDEEAEKCRDLFDRGQYESNMLKSALSAFLCFLRCFDNQNRTLEERIKGVMVTSVARTASELRLGRHRKKLTPLKTAVDRFAPGVDWNCYLDALDTRKRGFLTGDRPLADELNEHLIESFGYDYNGIHGSGTYTLILIGEHWDVINRILRHAMHPYPEYWEDTVLADFDALQFVGSVLERNGANLADKVLDHIFSVIKKDEVGRRVIENSIPLTFLNREDFFGGLEKRTFGFAFGRFGARYDLEKFDARGLCYPLVRPENADEKIAEGKDLFDAALKKIYPDDYGAVTGFIAGEIESPTRSVAGVEDWTMRTVFDRDTFGYHKNISDREAAAAYCPDYFSEENIWDRAYLKAYFMYGLAGGKETYAENLFEDFYDMFQFIEECTGVKTAYERDVSGRDEAFAGLKKLLKGYGVEISDKFKGDYVISLLDRKVAVRDESVRFPVLEQIGDAVYGFALAEMLFYDPEKLDEEVKDFHQEMVSAKYQIDIAKKIGTDKLYISPFTSSAKYERDTPINPDYDPTAWLRNVEYSESDKYIADSLEMVIGTMAEDLGYDRAIEFTKKIIRETYGDRFGGETHWTSEDTNAYPSFWERILPPPYTTLEHSQMTMWDAFDKLFKVIAIGTEDPVCRDFITQYVRASDVYGENASGSNVNKVFYEYLRNGLGSALEKYGDAVAENFRKRIDKKR